MKFIVFSFNFSGRGGKVFFIWSLVEGIFRWLYGVGYFNCGAFGFDFVTVVEMSFG
jgi:hypothetical protein